MKQLTYSLILLLLLCIVAVSTGAQNRLRRSKARPLTVGSNSSDIQKLDAGTLEERARIIEECESPDRPRPVGEIRMVSQLCGKAISRPQPRYPEEAKAAKVSGQVQISIVIDEQGRVIWSRALTGHTMLRDVSRRAACRARFSPTLISGRPIRTETSITYNFVLQ
jgi:TonB family protein